MEACHAPTPRMANAPLGLIVALQGFLLAIASPSNSSAWISSRAQIVANPAPSFFAANHTSVRV